MEKEPKETKASKKVHHPDDRFFKRVMEKKTSVEAYLDNFAPEISGLLDITTLEHSNESFIDKELDLFQSDIVYRCQLKNSKERIYLSFIWEHKSSPEQHVAIQIGLYLFSAMYKMSKQKERKLEIILPFLFYNGATNWKPKTVHELFSKIQGFDIFKKYIPDFQFLFKNVVRMNLLELLAIEDAFFKSAMLAMASRNNVDLIIERSPLILNYGEEVTATLNYILHFIRGRYRELKETIVESDNPLKNMIMSEIEQLQQLFVEIGKEEGIKIGEEKGIKIGKDEGIKIGEEKAEAALKNTIFKLHKRGFDVKMISDIVDRMEEYVETVILEKGLEEQKNKSGENKDAPIIE